MKFKIVLINFPFDDFSASKLRPALCLQTRHQFIAILFLLAITSNVANATENSDLIIYDNTPIFKTTGWKVASVIKVHRLLTASDTIIRKVIGTLPEDYYEELQNKIKLIFELE
ncbi:type II toxin-antitoxin system PemK/MazF family toxin [soil metagenome]